MEQGGRQLEAMRKETPTAGWVLALLALAAPAVAGPPASKHVQASLLAEVESLQPGHPFSVGIRLQMAEGWHTYWRNPADSGLPTRMTWRLPEGFQAGPLQWPVPRRLAAPPLMSYGYEGEVLLPVVITPPQTLSPGSEVRLAGRVDWLECQEACIPGRAELELVLPVRAEAPRPAPATATLFHATRGLLPVPARGWDLKAAAAPGVVALTFRAPQAPSGAYFFSDQPLVVDYPSPQTLHRVSGSHRLDITRAANGPTPSRLTGVLLIEGAAPLAVEVDVPVSQLAAPPGAGSVLPPAGRGLGVVLALAFLGGLALNLMPCVLPVLSLKVMSFVRQSGQESSRAWRHGVAFTAGVLLSFWLLAGLMLALRAGGRSVGWGFQLQSPTFVAFLAALFFVLGLNLFGVFSLGESLIAAANLNRERTGLVSSFGSGALATIVATPCTAPFMGSALGYGLTQPGAVSLLVFTALALGMASPYLLLSLNPRLLRLVPRPGAWMEGFQQFLGFLLMATVVALLWLLGREAGVEGMTRVLLALLALGLAAWLYGRAPSSGLGPRARLLAPAAAALFLALGLVLGVRQADGGGRVGGESGLNWEAYSPETLASLRAQGKPVFIDFTAAWCLTCQVNERVALASSEVQDRFRREGVVALRADWTQNDQDITAALASYGRQGVPLYVVYARDPGRPPRVLPEVITPGIVLGALDEALGDARTARGLTSDITSPQ
jgi:thiol:disulfide interchange protein/DsbC/DsbD-like thiol-disulfide interchange protein